MSAELLFVLGTLTSIIVWLLKKAFIDKGLEVPTWVYSIVLGFVALGLSLFFAPVVLPPFPPHADDLISFIGAILTYAGALLPVIVAIVGFAKIIYEALLQKILDALGKKVKAALNSGSDVG